MSQRSQVHRLILFWNTVRYLRPVQVWGRLWFRLYRPRPQLAAAAESRRAQAKWIASPRPASMRAANQFEFVGETHRITQAGDWNHPEWPKLWLYNAHYFDDLVADAAADRKAWHEALIERWITENPPSQGNGWEPYPTSLRIVNWFKWHLAGNALSDKAQHSLAVQARWLRKKLEIHLLGNHLWANAKALVFAGAHFSGTEADQWRDKGLGLIRRELDEQILADGGHFERSPMYHAIVLEDVLDLIQLSTAFPDLFGADDREHWRSVATRMLSWLAVMTHPDGRIALFNDAAFGIAPEFHSLQQHAQLMGIECDPHNAASIIALKESGYVRLQNYSAVLIADVGEIGPDYLPGHAHADTLSFELSVHGERVIVDAGTSRYDAGPDRLWQRSTAAHNSIEIDNQSSSEVWSSFRVGRRARVVSKSFGADEEGVWLRATHDGYRRLSGKPLHTREWRLGPNSLTVHDTIEGEFQQAVARLRFHPDCVVESTSACAGSIGLTCSSEAAAATSIRWQSNVESRIIDSTWHPQFGLSQECQVLQTAAVDKRVVVTLTWNPIPPRR